MMMYVGNDKVEGSFMDEEAFFGLAFRYQMSCQDMTTRACKEKADKMCS
jgi:hypothetical protein